MSLFLYNSDNTITSRNVFLTFTLALLLSTRCYITIIIIIIIIINQGVSLSLRRKRSLHGLYNFLSFAMWLHEGPTYRIKSSHHLVLGRFRGLLCPEGFHSVTLILRLLSRLLATCSAHLCLFSLCFRIQFVRLLSLRVNLTMILSIFLWVVISFSTWVLLSDQVSQPYGIPCRTHLLNAFLFSLIGTFLSRMMLFSLQNAFHPCPILLFISCTWYWSLVTICPIYTYL